MSERRIVQKWMRDLDRLQMKKRLVNFILNAIKLLAGVFFFFLIFIYFGGCWVFIAGWVLAFSD